MNLCAKQKWRYRCRDQIKGLQGETWGGRNWEPGIDTHTLFTVVIQPSHVQLFATPWTAACQASLFVTISWSLLKFKSIESVMFSIISSSVTTFSSCPQSFPASESFPMSQLFPSGGQSIGASASASVLPVNIQGWFPLGLTGLIGLVKKLA